MNKKSKKGNLSFRFAAGIVLLLALFITGVPAMAASNALVEDKGIINQCFQKNYSFTISGYSEAALELTDESYGTFQMKIYNQSGKVVFEEKNGELWRESKKITFNLPKGEYRMALIGTFCGGFHYDFKLTSKRIATTAEPIYKLKKTKMDMKVGQKTTMGISVTPATVKVSGAKWTSSNKKVATVDANGKVTAKASGTARIQCVINKQKLSCEVKVLAPKMSKTSYAFYAKDTATLKADNIVGTAKWKSSKPAVVTVKNGKITAVKPGNATITATVGSYKLTCKVTVKKEALSKTKVSLYAGAKETLKLNGATAKVTWSSNKKSVATVTSKGVVTAKAAGTATITAKVGKKTYKSTITVIEDRPKLSKTALTLDSSETHTLKVTGTLKAITWSSDNESVATVSKEGTVTAKKEGTAVITASVKGGSKVTCTVKVNADMLTRVSAPINSPYLPFAFTVNSMDGVNLCWNARNLTSKTITSYTCKVFFYDAAGKAVTDKNTGLAYKEVTYTSTVAPQGQLVIYGNIGYVPSCSKVVIEEIQLNYADGTNEKGKYVFLAARQ